MTRPRWLIEPPFTNLEIGIAVLGVILGGLGGYLMGCWLFGVRL